MTLSHRTLSHTWHASNVVGENIVWIPIHSHIGVLRNYKYRLYGYIIFVVEIRLCVDVLSKMSAPISKIGKSFDDTDRIANGAD